MNEYLHKQIKEGVLFFIKYPFLGEVKSRLSIEFEENLTATLYKTFVEDLLMMLKRTKYPVLVCYYPPNVLNEFQEWLGNNYRYLPQNGDDLGERLKNSFIQGFKLEFKKLIVIGSDSPDLPERIIKEAIQKLNEYDTVIGPCKDGGYYLIGFTNKSYSPSVFEGITWSTSSVFEKTIKILNSKALQSYILELWSDVDTFDDLKNLYLRNVETNFKTSKTMNFLRENIQKITDS